MPHPLLSFFGDDFTGSTDALELLALAGMKTRLFTRVPSEAEIRSLDAYGVAGDTRSMSADAMERELRNVLPRMAALPARLVHYKVCSTFDSSPQIGSIGRAIDVGFDVFNPNYVPVVAAAPSLGRYSAFGNLFARYGGDGDVFRLDRHPSVSRHPVTPMTEADIAQHLAQQTARTIRLIDFRHYDAPPSTSLAKLNDDAVRGSVVLLDLLRESELTRLGQMLDRPGDARFIAGSSGVESALCEWWKENALLRPAGATRAAAAPLTKSPLVVLCGSCSPVSTGQVDWAIAQGFAEFRLDVRTCITTRLIRDAVACIREGRSAIIHTAGDAMHADIDRGLISRTLAEIAAAILEAVRVRRIVIAGGDTSGAIAQSLNISWFDMVAPLVRGAPVVRATAPGAPADNVEFVFKGGQVGSVDFFGTAAAGARSLS